MSGINTGILTNAYPLSTARIKELEAEVLNGGGSFAYLDENSKLCFTMRKGVDSIKELAWDNAYELTNAGSLLTKRAYKKTGLKTFALDSTYTKSSLNASWASGEIPVFEFDGVFTGNEFDQGPTDSAGNYGGYGGINGQCCFVKVSDRVFTHDELLGSTLCINRKGKDEFLEITANNIVNLSTPEECAFVIHNNEFSIACVYVVPNNDFEPPKTSGTYFMFIDGLDVKTNTTTSIYTKSISCLTVADALYPTSTTERLEGDGQEFYTTAPSTLSFRSTAPLNEFQDVQINGQTVDPSNYTLEEGSTIVKLSHEYLKTLDAGSYELSVISNSKTVKGGFTVSSPELNEHGFYYNYPYSFTTANYPEYAWGRSDGNHCLIFKDASTVGYFFNSGTYWGGYNDFEYFIEGANVVMEASGFTTVLSFSGSFTNAGKTLVCDTFCVVADGGGLSAEWVESSGISLELNTTGGLLADRHCLYSYNDTNKAYKVETIFSEYETAVIAREIMGSPVTSLCPFNNTGYITTLVLPDTITSIPSCFIAYDDILVNIVFKGTVAQWDAIDKEKYWFLGTSIDYVQCADGTAAIQGGYN